MQYLSSYREQILQNNLHRPGTGIRDPVAPQSITLDIRTPPGFGVAVPRRLGGILS